jgi:hypothetical protein
MPVYFEAIGLQKRPRIRAMKDKIREFLANSGGRASALAIAQKVLRLTQASPVLAERVLASLLQNDKGFASDGMGNWHILAENATGAATASVKVFLVGTPMRPQEILRAKSVVLGWAACTEASEPSVTSTEVLLSAAASSEDENYPRVTRQEFIARFAAQFTDSVIISWQPHAVTQAFRRIYSGEGELWLPAMTISLATLARNLLGINRRPTLPGLYRQLCGSQIWREGIADLLQAQVEILHVLSDKCREQGLKEWIQIAAFARHARRADFTSYAFDESHIDSLPVLPGVYVMRDTSGGVLYVGKAANLRARVRSYFQTPGMEDRKLKQLRSQMFTLDYKVVESELDALLLEHRLISRWQPKTNRQKKILPSPLPQAMRPQGIFLVPVHPSFPPATKGRVIVYLLSPQSLQRMSVALGRKPGKRLRLALADFYEEVSRTAHAGKRPAKDRYARLEIAARLFQKKAARINVLDPADCADLQELENRLHLLLRSPETMAAKVCFTAVPHAAARVEA